MDANVESGMSTIRAAGDSRSFNVLDNVVTALREDVSLYNMGVESVCTEDDSSDEENEGIDVKRIPLDQYLATVREVAEDERFLTGNVMFDIWKALPSVLTNHQEKIGVSKDEAPILLERFNAYTWNEHEPKLREKYMRILKKSLWVADKKVRCGWSAESESPNLSAIALGIVNKTPEFTGLKGFYDLKRAMENAGEAERQFEQIPPERMLDIFTRAGWKRMEARDKEIIRLGSELKERAQKTIGYLTKLGDEYRRLHTEKYYPKVK